MLDTSMLIPVISLYRDRALKRALRNRHSVPRSVGGELIRLEGDVAYHMTRAMRLVFTILARKHFRTPKLWDVPPSSRTKSVVGCALELKYEVLPQLDQALRRERESKDEALAGMKKFAEAILESPESQEAGALA